MVWPFGVTATERAPNLRLKSLARKVCADPKAWSASMAGTGPAFGTSVTPAWILSTRCPPPNASAESAQTMHASSRVRAGFSGLGARIWLYRLSTHLALRRTT